MKQLAGRVTIAVTLIAVVAFALFRYWANHFTSTSVFEVDMPLDLWIYLRGGERVLDGVNVYEGPIFNDLPFTYPPFAAMIFAGLSLLNDATVAVVWQTGTLLGVAWVIWACLKRLNVQVTPLHAVLIPLLTAVFVLVTEPVHATMFWGQINVVLMVLVCLDFLPTKHRLPGIGVGLAAGIKLTPAFFGLLFLVQRRWLDAFISFVTFLVTVAVGYLAVPDAHVFWTRAVFDSERIGVHTNPGAQSLRSILIRVYGVDSTTVWAAIVFAMLVLLTWAVWLCVKHDNIPAAVGLTGIGACMVSPFSWYHHWVWIVPFGVAVFVAANRAAAAYAQNNPVRWQVAGVLSVGAMLLVITPYCATNVAAGWFADRGSTPLQLSERLHLLRYVTGALLMMFGTAGYYLLQEKRHGQEPADTADTADNTAPPVPSVTTVGEHDLQLRGQSAGHR
nr:Polyprenol-phosphate-mannose-dependent alpha-(1-2)-phosphatidylinositol pentamannoside mannosyltransferase [Streptococcus thermophilus]